MREEERAKRANIAEKAQTARRRQAEERPGGGIRGRGPLGR